MSSKPLVPWVEFHCGTKTRYRLVVSLTQEAHGIVAAYCERSGTHTDRFYRETFDAGLRAALIARGEVNGSIEHGRPGEIRGAGSPEPAVPTALTLDDDRKAVRAAAWAYRNRRQE